MKPSLELLDRLNQVCSKAGLGDHAIERGHLGTGGGVKGWGSIYWPERWQNRQRNTLHYRHAARKTLCGLPITRWRSRMLNGRPRLEPAFVCGNCARIRRAELENAA